MQSGVYRILNLDIGRKYIGSSVDAPLRLRNHKGALRKGKHPIADLQEDWNNLANFSFEVIEWCEPSKLKECEQSYVPVLTCGRQRWEQTLKEKGFYNRTCAIYSPPLDYDYHRPMTVEEVWALYCNERRAELEECYGKLDAPGSKLREFLTERYNCDRLPPVKITLIAPNESSGLYLAV